MVMIAWASFVAYTASQSAAETSTQDTSHMTVSAPETRMVLPMSDVDEALQITVGQSQLLTNTKPFSTIIVGDETIANASLGPENSIVLTGLAVGSTNFIVLGEGQESLLTARISVVPVAGPLRSTVTIMKGDGKPETYECRGVSCGIVSGDAERPEFPFVLMTPPDAASAEEPADQ